MDWPSSKVLALDSKEQNLFYLESLLILNHGPFLNNADIC